MSEEEIARIQNELKTCKEQLDALREDLKIVVKYTASLRDQVLTVADQSGNPSFAEAEVKRCQDFRDKYKIHIV
jgi:hypothetical protein